MTYSEVFEALGRPLGEILEQQRQIQAQQPEEDTPEHYEEIINLIFD